MQTAAVVLTEEKNTQPLFLEVYLPFLTCTRFLTVFTTITVSNNLSNNKEKGVRCTGTAASVLKGTSACKNLKKKKH